MKKTGIYLSLIVAMAGAFTLASCSEEKEYPPVVIPADYGSGTWDSPVSVNQVIEGTQEPDMWVTGYIVGWINTNVSLNYNSQSATFTVPATNASNMLLAASPDERDFEKCIPVQLLNGSEARKALNLVDNPANLGRLVTIKGNGGKYFGRNGLLSVALYNWGDQGIYEEPAPDVPDTPTTGSTIYSASKSSGLNAFTYDNILLPEGSTYVWKIDTKYGLVASGYIGGACKPSESIAISPAIDLTGYKEASLTFRHAGNKFNNAAGFAAACSLQVREQGGEWTSVAIPNMCDGNSWTFIDSGTINLSSYAGKKIEFGFHYTSTASVAGSWEIDDIKVNAAK